LKAFESEFDTKPVVWQINLHFSAGLYFDTAMPLPGALQQELCGKSIRDAVYGSVQKMLSKSR